MALHNWLLMLSCVALNALIEINACHYAHAQAHTHTHTHMHIQMQVSCFKSVWYSVYIITAVYFSLKVWHFHQIGKLKHHNRHLQCREAVENPWSVYCYFAHHKRELDTGLHSCGLFVWGNEKHELPWVPVYWLDIVWLLSCFRC